MIEEGLVCWTKMQAEAGQSLSDIVLRKERERVAGQGLFCWGVGNAPSKAIRELAKASVPVDLVFSVMLGRPRKTDVAPERVVAWRGYVDADGNARSLPGHVLVTSKGKAGAHYALMATSAAPLKLDDLGPFHHECYRNVGDKGGPIGASQVTSLARRVAEPDGPAKYRVAMRARLALGYWVRLVDPVDHVAGRP